MERERQKNAQLKWRVVKDIVAILGISLFISAICGFFYFKRVVCEQKISDEKVKQLQLSNQLTFMAEDIQRYAENILVDGQIQEFLEEKPESEYEKRRKYDRISRRLTFYTNLRSYISDTYLVMEDGNCYKSNYQKSKQNSFEIEAQKKDMLDYFSEAGNNVSNWYFLKEDDSDRESIYYRVPLLDKYQYGDKIGVLYIEIFLDYFLEQVRLYGDAYDNLCLMDDNLRILYEKDKDDIVQRFIDSGHGTEEETYHIKEGYMICTEIEITGWKLCTMIPEDQMWKSSYFVLQFFGVSFLFSIGMVIIFFSKIMERIVHPVVRLSEQMEKEDYANLGHIEIVHTGDEIETLYRCYCAMIEKIQEEEERQREQEKKKKEMEFAIMHSQIAPHYLYNVLNTVIFLAVAQNNNKIADIVRALIYTLQETLEIGDDHMETTVAKELKLVEAYLDIQKYRYGRKYRSNIFCEEDLKDCMVPKTIIQPMVENALIHGILPAERLGIVNVYVYESDSRMFIEIEDDGIGISEEYLGEGKIVRKNGEEKKDIRRHIGIDNVRKRIRYLYGEEYGMKIEKREEGGTKIQLYLPLKKRREYGE